MHLAVVGDLGFRHFDLTLEIVDLIAALQGLRLDVELHLLVVGHHVALVDLHVIEINAGAGEPLLGRHHTGRERCHHFTLGQPLQVAQLAGVGRLQFAVAAAVVGVLGQGCIQGPLLREQTLGIAVVELLVMALQLAQVAALLLQLALQHGQVELHQHLAALHPLAHLHVHLTHLAAGTGVEDAGVIGVDQHPRSLHLRGHRPEEGPEHHRAGDTRQAHTHLVVIAQPLPALTQLPCTPPVPGRISSGGGLSHGRQLAGIRSRCQPPAGQTPSCCSRWLAGAEAPASAWASSGASTGTWLKAALNPVKIHRPGA